ncbi:MAG TPA: tetratricopeptide repeat protein [Saprospiraceae bacterium]|nr:tetratricopeptide repeat protein [Saprospiraceae bacterium]
MKSVLLLFLFSSAGTLFAQNTDNDSLKNILWDQAADARKLGYYETSLRLLSRAVSLYADDADLYNSRGKTYFDMAMSGRYDHEADTLLALALADYNVSIRAAHNDTIKSEAMSNRAAVFGVQGNFEKCLEDLNAAVLLNPENLNAYLNRSLLYTNTGEYALAIDDLSRYLDRKPDSEELLYERGMLHRTLSQSRLALDDLNRAIALNPDAPGLYFLERARAHAQAGHKKAARADYEEAERTGASLAADDREWLKKKK